MGSILFLGGVLPFKHTFLYVFKCKLREREQPPRFAQPGTFEFEYASRWKALDEMEKQQREQVDRNIREAKEKLEAEMEAARHEHQLMLMRQGKMHCHVAVITLFLVFDLMFPIDSVVLLCRLLVSSF